MKRIILFLTIGLFLQGALPAEGQSVLNKLKQKTERAKDKTNEKVDDEIDETVDESIDNAFEQVGNLFKKKDKQENSAENISETNVGSEGNASVIDKVEVSPQLWTKYDFVPGDTVIFEDLLENEQNGEFPSKWDLKTGNVEIAILGNETVINFPTTKRADIVPLMKEKGDYLPEKFTIEFDAYFSEFCTEFTINFYDMVNQKNPEKLPYITIRPGSYIIAGQGRTDISEDRNFPYWQRVAVSFNIRSLKVYFGEQRNINIPNLGANPSGFTIGSKQCHEGQVSLLKNIRIAKGSMNLYERVVTDGKFVTNGLRFDVGKATLKPESMGVINQIFKLMSEHVDLNFSVEGHTDSDGDEAHNQKLSEERAATVKNTLVERGIEASRLSTNGFGESKPVDSNSTPEGKANNRRVEFVKI